MKYRSIAAVAAPLLAAAALIAAHMTLQHRREDALEELARRGAQANADPGFYALLRVIAPECCPKQETADPLATCDFNGWRLNSLALCSLPFASSQDDADWEALVDEVLAGGAEQWDSERWEAFESLLEARESFLDAGRTLADWTPDKTEQYMLNNAFGPGMDWHTRTRIQRVLTMQAVLEAHRGNWEDFTRELSLTLMQGKCGEQTNSEGAKHASLAALRNAHAAMRSVAPGDLDREKTVCLLASIAEFTGEGDLPATLAMQTIRDLYNAQAPFDYRASSGAARTERASVISFGRNDLGMGDYLVRLALTEYTKQMNKAISAAQHPYYEVRDTLKDLSNPSWISSALHLDVPEVPVNAFVEKAHRETLAGLMRVGLLAELYYAEHGAWPENLRVIESTFRVTLPTDPFRDAPFVYQRGETGFTLYSVGENGRDDGGRDDATHGDLVWRGASLSQT